MADYNDHKTSLVKFGDFSIIQEEVEQLKKNCQTMVSKKDFYDRYTVLFNDLTCKLKKKVGSSEMNTIRTKIYD